MCIRDRYKGFLGALELVKDKGTRERFDAKGSAGIACRDAAGENKLIMRAVEDSMIMCPPLIISHAEIDEMVEKIGLSLDQANTSLRSH